MSHQEALKKIARIFANQQKILQKLSQMPVSEMPVSEKKTVSESLVDPSKGTAYLDPDSDLYSDLEEAVRALTSEETDMSDTDDDKFNFKWTVINVSGKELPKTSLPTGYVDYDEPGGPPISIEPSFTPSVGFDFGEKVPELFVLQVGDDYFLIKTKHNRVLRFTEL